MKINFLISLLFACSFAQTTNCFLYTLIYKTVRTGVAAGVGVFAYNHVPEFVEKLVKDNAINIKNYIDNIKLINLKDYISTEIDIANKLTLLYKITAVIVIYEATKISIDTFFTSRKDDSKE